jgi:hypothetical protein
MIDDFLDHPQPYSACGENAFAAYPKDCTRYLHCLWGKYEVFNCAPGLHWSNVSTQTSDDQSVYFLYRRDKSVTGRRKPSAMVPAASALQRLQLRNPRTLQFTPVLSLAVPRLLVPAGSRPPVLVTRSGNPPSGTHPFLQLPRSPHSRSHSNPNQGTSRLFATSPTGPGTAKESDGTSPKTSIQTSAPTSSTASQFWTSRS